MNAKDVILERLRLSGGSFLAVHELQLQGYSENNLATRLSELAREGKVVSRPRQGTHYKEWALIHVGAPHLVIEENGQGRML